MGAGYGDAYLYPTIPEQIQVGLWVWRQFVPQSVFQDRQATKQNNLVLKK